MLDFEFSAHTIEMLKERNIAEEWVRRTLNTPDKQRRGEDGNMQLRESNSRTRWARAACYSQCRCATESCHNGVL